MPDWIDADALRGWLPELKSAARILAILLAAWVVQLLARRIVLRLQPLVSSRSGGLEYAKRIETLSRVVRYAITVLVLMVAGMLILNEVGVSIAPILGAAGVVGLAIGFGAQSLVKDYFTGFFLLVENQIRVGDVVNVAGKSGLVEEITLRHVKLRDYDGSVHFIPNSVITTVTNSSTEFAQAVIDVPVAYRSDIDQAFEVLRGVARGMRADREYAPRILDDLEIAGVENLADPAILVRCRIRVAPLEQWGVRREFLKRVNEEFDRVGIGVAAPTRTIYQIGGTGPIVEAARAKEAERQAQERAAAKGKPGKDTQAAASGRAPPDDTPPSPGATRDPMKETGTEAAREASEAPSASK